MREKRPSVTRTRTHRERVLDQARSCLGRGWGVVPVPRGRKGPVLKDWQALQLTEEELKDFFGEDDNVGVLLGEPSGGLGDIDLDCREAISLAKLFLPKTDRVHGREGRRSSHHWFIARPTLHPANFADINGRSLVEIRSTGQQTLIPPSG